MSDDDKMYEVGYGRPPQGKQFKKGRSGNPKGRPKGSKNIRTIVFDELARRISIIENGKRKAISMSEAIVKQHVNRAAAGSEKAAQFVLQLMKETGQLSVAKVKPQLQIRMEIDRPNFTIGDASRPLLIDDKKR